ncbi:isoaspartyl peptidase/L-asparaginase [Enhygromyxa salina]|uniref:Isoaspartyl peptidase n=1 Tax=Enhygromyxa salina TaxID=215803 RepID=A0A2S9YW23_9BACT|nr:isoaspartyl peptidase/L-asparaginase [Enhygromyxa salina]PRQ09305.1 Isoaspartyl peptidase precursor [Enhygromyxa salina]
MRHRSPWPWVLSLVALAACHATSSVGEVPAPTTHERSVERLEADPARVGPLILAHGGQGSPASRSDGPAAAVERGFEQLEHHAGDQRAAVAAAIATIELLEDDPRFNAGTGANLRLDGVSIEADAAIMDDRERFGAVAGIAGIRHPIRVAEAVADSPHLLLVGDGAQKIAATLGLETRDLATPQARAKLERGYARLFSEPADGPWAQWDWRAHWNFETPAPASLDEAMALLRAAELAAADDGESGPQVTPDQTQDTVGVVVRTAQGRYAAALSTGGTTLAIHGRVGDVPILGAGLYAGPDGAVAATGKGEAIIRERVAARVYDLLARGHLPKDAINAAIREISPEEGVGVIAVSQQGWSAVATSQMAWAARDRDQRHRADTFIQHRDR